MTARHIPLDGAFNFRDLGGYGTVDGRALRWRVLFRADGLHRLSDADQEQFHELGIRTVVDLRTVSELEEVGRAPEGIDFHHLPMMDVLPDRTEYPNWVDDEFLVARYCEILDNGAPAIAAAVEVLAGESTLPAVFHCTAGKDRTGILAAVLLGLLGVPDDVIVQDYVLSAEAMERMLAWLRDTYPDRQDELDRREAAMLAARPKVMEGLLAHVRHEYGGVEGFVAAHGAAGAIDPLRNALLEPGP